MDTVPISRYTFHATKGAGFVTAETEKYGHLSKSYVFIPVSCETLEAFGPETMDLHSNWS